jgi:hypothetical protein
MHWASLGVLAGVAGRGFRPGADRAVEDVCNCSLRCFVCCLLLPLLVEFFSFELVLYHDVEYLTIGNRGRARIMMLNI